MAKSGYQGQVIEESDNLRGFSPRKNNNLTMTYQLTSDPFRQIEPGTIPIYLASTPVQGTTYGSFCASFTRGVAPGYHYFTPSGCLDAMSMVG